VHATPSKPSPGVTAKLCPALLCALLAVASLISSCGPPPPPLETELSGEAETEFRKGNFNLAAKHYEELLEQYPFSEEAEEARLRVAESHYLNEDYEKAIAAFQDFERIHPTSPLLPFVEYSIGMSYLDQRRTKDRDKSSTENALRQFESVADRYVDTLYGRLALYRIRQCHETLASHELYVGDYYRGKKDRNAAVNRYRYLLQNYPNTVAAFEAAQRLQELGETTETGIQAPATPSGPAASSSATPRETSTAVVEATRASSTASNDTGSRPPL